ncbi:MAG: hypothetical protein JO043_13410 [Candidatus Eremiobacteraeota bacterium]|nr:hypothetical protein [Candidatus Eremiobacteraeota bacterium]
MTALTVLHALVMVGGRLFAGGPNTNAVDAYVPYAQNPPPLRQITNGLFAPTGMAVDGHGNLYVCNNAGQSLGFGTKGFWTVTVYTRHGSTPFRTYTNGVWNPVDVAVAADGTTYVANFGSHVVTVYPSHSINPSKMLVAPPNSSPLGIAFDSAGRVYVSYVLRSGGAGSIYVYNASQTHGKNIGIAFSGEPHGIALDARNNLIVAVSKAPGSGSDVEVYPPGAKQPSLRLPGPFQPFMLTLDPNGNRLYVADYGSGNNDGGVWVFSYPSGRQLYKDTQGTAAGAYGVAFDPR